MSGKHSNAKSNNPVLIIVGIIVAIAIVVLVILFVKNNSKNENKSNSISTTSAESTGIVLSDIDNDIPVQSGEKSDNTINGENKNISANENADTNSEVAEITADAILAPTDSQSETIMIDTSNTFDVSFKPISATDSETGEECTLQEVFGSSYQGGTFDFNSDGSFNENISLSSANTGTYKLTDDKLLITYINDNNLETVINDWSDNVPSEFTLNIGGYEVLFRS